MMNNHPYYKIISGCHHYANLAQFDWMKKTFYTLIISIAWISELFSFLRRLSDPFLYGTAEEPAMNRNRYNRELYTCPRYQTGKEHIYNDFILVLLGVQTFPVFTFINLPDHYRTVTMKFESTPDTITKQSNTRHCSYALFTALFSLQHWQVKINYCLLANSSLTCSFVALFDV